MQKIFWFALLVLISAKLGAQSGQVEILSANSLESEKRAGKKVTKLIGNVRLKQENTILSCDSAYKFDETNYVEAYSNVHINHNDSVHMYGDELQYDGAKKYAKLKRNVRMNDAGIALTTDEIEFDMNSSVAWYSTGGRIVSGNSVLTSRFGYYYTRSKEFYYKKDVLLVNPEYTISSDTMKYNTVTKLTYFYGPTNIVSKDDKIYCERGWYNTEKGIASFSKNAQLSSQENQLRADSIFYDRKAIFGKAFGHIEMIDTANDVVVYGDYGELLGKKRQNFVTGHAVAKQDAEGDSLFLMADTLYSFQRAPGQRQQLRAYFHAKIYKADLQAIADSLVYDNDDSTITLFHEPIMWSGYNQISSDTIIMYINNSKLDSFTLVNNAFVISREGAKEFNQVKGKNMKGRFDDNKVRYIHVYGNGQSIYYAKEDSAYMGVNVINCSEMEFFFAKNKIEKGNFITNPDAVFYPLNQLKPEELRLKGFKWHQRLRPDKQLVRKRLNKI